MPNLRTVIFVCDNPYNSTSLFATSLAEALVSLGVEVRVLPLIEGEEGDALREVFFDPPDFTCSYSDITLAGTPLGEAWRIPHLSFLIDPFPYFLHQTKGLFSHVSTADLADLEQLNKLKCDRSFLLPHAAPKELAEEKTDEKIYDLVFFGTAIDPEEVLKNSKYKKTLIDASEKVLAPNGISCFEALVECGAFSYQPQFFELFRELDLYIRGVDRVELLKALSGLRLTIFGDKIHKKGWAELLANQPNAAIYPSLPFEETIGIMKKAKCVLNSSPRLRHGSHERIFYGMAAGAIAVTGANRFIEKHFSEDLVTYEYGKWSPIKDKLAELLDDPIKFSAVAEKGRQAVLDRHTYHHRAKTLITYLKNSGSAGIGGF